MNTNTLMPWEHWKKRHDSREQQIQLNMDIGYKTRTCSPPPSVPQLSEPYQPDKGTRANSPPHTHFMYNFDDNQSWEKYTLSNPVQIVRARSVYFAYKRSFRRNQIAQQNEGVSCQPQCRAAGFFFQFIIC